MGITHEKSRGVEDKLNVGDRVSVEFGMRRVGGTVVEDRGGLGLGGRNLYRVVLDLEHDPPLAVELPAEDFLKAA